MQKKKQTNKQTEQTRKRKQNKTGKKTVIKWSLLQED